MRIKGITDEDFVNYKVPSMFVIANSCSFKCNIDLGEEWCHNKKVINQPTLTIDNEDIIKRYLSNPITHAIVFGGLEPMDQFDELYQFIDTLRNKYKCNDNVVIYTGYYPDEIQSVISKLEFFPNIIVKFGRFLPNQKPHFDDVLGVSLCSDNQFARVLDYEYNEEQL